MLSEQRDYLRSVVWMLKCLLWVFKLSCEKYERNIHSLFGSVGFLTSYTNLLHFNNNVNLITSTTITISTKQRKKQNDPVQNINLSVNITQLKLPGEAECELSQGTEALT